MAYLMWPFMGIVVAMLIGGTMMRRGTGWRRRPPFIVGAFGGFVGGIIGDGLPHAQGTDFNPPSIIGALVGALIFCLAMRERASDTDG